MVILKAKFSLFLEFDFGHKHVQNILSVNTEIAFIHPLENNKVETS